MCRAAEGRVPACPPSPPPPPLLSPSGQRAGACSGLCPGVATCLGEWLPLPPGCCHSTIRSTAAAMWYSIYHSCLPLFCNCTWQPWGCLAQMLPEAERPRHAAAQRVPLYPVELGHPQIPVPAELLQGWGVCGAEIIILPFCTAKQN